MWSRGLWHGMDDQWLDMNDQQSQETPQLRDKENLKICQKHNKNNTKLNINTCIIKLQTFTSNVQE